MVFRICFLFGVLAAAPVKLCDAQQPSAPHLPGSVFSPALGPARKATSEVEALPLEQMAISEPLLLEKAEFPGFTRELWQMKWRSGDAIDLYVVKPPHMKRPPVVIFLYSFPSDTDRFRNDDYCRTVVKDGFAAIGFVSALTGQRYHDRPWKEWFVTQLPEALVMTVHDISLILDYLQTRSDLDTRKIGIFGQGSGGTIALLAASVEPRLRAVDVLDPWGDWPDWFQRSSLLLDKDRTSYDEPAFRDKLVSLDPAHVLGKLNGRRLRLQQNEADTITPEVAQKKIAAAVPPRSRLICYRSMDEYTQKAAKNGRILSWLARRLGLAAAG